MFSLSSRLRTSAAGLTAAVAALALGAACPPAASAAEGTILNANTPDSVAGSYLVHFRQSAALGAADITERANQLAARHGGQLRHVYDAVGGFAVDMNEAAAKRLAAEPSVEFVEQDKVVRASGEQTDPVWGLDRIDQRNLPLDRKYTYPDNAGAGTTVYVVDTGVDVEHPEFEGRAKHGYDFIDDDDEAEDCHGHGTHVAGTVAGATYGVAKKANIVGVRVLDCSGYSRGSSVVSGLNWVAKNAQKPAVVNMSLGGSANSSTDRAVRSLVNAGVTVAVAAGNENQDACNVSPARVREAITVAASDSADKRSIWRAPNVASNYGRCVDLFAPGSNILSAKPGGGTATMGGTSMATPHVAGAAALYLGQPGNSAKSPSEVADALLSASTPGKIRDVKGSPNKLLYVGFLNQDA
ncbi:S8 family peptidase [Streptoalloteichus hindustanus]|uniref:Peptidase inhibitor I9 n=1 Tax=Streptoalloteichus hindustanus TaxID=2017 RepID=A0A1M5MYV3_STRHI|nr:S8 family peptidase [Streptoalloteichus hindustanus]SHG82385.1 Peptidase inhibitor I9 [Streptoalloteichus hindustanus]